MEDNLGETVTRPNLRQRGEEIWTEFVDSPARMARLPLSARGWALICCVSCALGVLWRWPSFNHLRTLSAYYIYSFANLQYSDVMKFWSADHLGAHQFPYVQQNIEYPVLTGMTMWITALAPDIHGYFLANAILLTFCMVGCVLLVGRLQPASAPWRFALAPAVPLYVILNWDALGLIALVSGVYFMSRQRCTMAGVCLAVGTSAKLFPGFALPAFVIYSAWTGWCAWERSSERYGASDILGRLTLVVNLLVGFLAVALAINLPVALLTWHGWSYFITFQSARGINPDAIWAHLPAASQALANAWYPRLFLLVLALILFELWRRRGVGWEAATLLSILDFLLFTKDYSPQYDLWILPFLALLLCPLWLWLVYCVADVAYYGGIFWNYFISFGGHPPLFTDRGALLDSAVRGREVMLGLVFIWTYRRLRQSTPVWGLTGMNGFRPSLGWTTERSNGATGVGTALPSGAHPPQPIWKGIDFQRAVPQWLARCFVTGPGRRGHVSTGRIAVWLGGFLLLCFTYFAPHFDANQMARLDLSVAIVDHGSFSIDPYQANTPDKDLYHGHYYSLKSPGSGFLGVPVYGLYKGWFAVRGGLPAYTPGDLQLRYLLSSILVALPATLFLLLFFWFLGYFSASRANRALLTLAVGLGTIYFSYSMNFYAHVPVAGLLFAAVVLLYILSHPEAVRGSWTRTVAAQPKVSSVLIGLVLGMTILLEYPVAAVAGIIGIYALISLPWRMIPYIVLGALPPLMMLMTYDYSIYGNPLADGYTNGVNGWNSYYTIGAGGFVFPPIRDAVWGMSLSPYRGLFFLSPFLVLAFPGYWIWAKRGGREWLLFLIVPVAYFLLISSFVTWWGGWAAGPRYIIPVVLFLAFPIIFVLDWMSLKFAGSIVRYTVYASMLVGAVSVCAETITNAAWPNDSIVNPLFDVCLPALLRGDLSRNRGTMVFGLTGLASLWPLFTALGLWSLGAFGPAALSRFWTSIDTGSLPAGVRRSRG